jgi:hypothetical protein
MRVRVAYSQEYLSVRNRLDPIARRALEIVEDGIAQDPEVGPYRQQIGDWIFDFHGLQGDLIIRYRWVNPEAIEFSALKDMRNPDL